jgi:hypothetical protein
LPVEKKLQKKLQIVLLLPVAGFFRGFREMKISTKVRCDPNPILS